MTTRQIGLSAAQGLANKALNEMGGDNQLNGGGNTNGGNAAVKPELPKPIDGKVLQEASDIKTYINYIDKILKADKGSPDWKAIQADAKDPYSLAGQIAELAKIKLVAFDQSFTGQRSSLFSKLCLRGEPDSVAVALVQDSRFGLGRQPFHRLCGRPGEQTGGHKIQHQRIRSP